MYVGCPFFGAHPTTDNRSPVNPKVDSQSTLGFTAGRESPTPERQFAMPESPAYETIPAELRHAEARSAQQRETNAAQRAAVLEDFVTVVGGQAEAGELLGISKAAVSKALVATRRRQQSTPPLADFVELDLASCGRQVPTIQEWEQLRSDEQQTVAERSARTWAALATTLGHLYEQTHAACEWLASIAIGHLDLDDPDDAVERPTLVTDADLAEVTAPQACRTSSARITVLGDMARAFDAQRRKAWLAKDWWQNQADRLAGLPDDAE